MRLEALETLIPEARAGTADIIRSAGGKAEEIKLFTALFGMHQVAVADPDTGVDGYLQTLLSRLPAAPVCSGAQILLHAHSLPMPHARRLQLQPLRRHPVLRRLTAVCDIDQFNCAGMFHALQMAQRLLGAGAAGEVFVFAGDCLSDWPLAARYVPSCTVLGDGYALLRLTARDGGVQIGPVATRHFPGFEGGLDGGAAQMERYNRAHLEIISDSLARIGHDPQAAMLFPHNINGLAWRLYCRQHNQNAAQVHDGLVAGTGHCCNADPFLVLDPVLREQPVNGTLISVGMAGFAGAAAIRGDLRQHAA
ncbi:hypothetical protein [Leisingera thetidis]|uniref:hypothetical protein n=1 Tax=Leisingera thetidis TaxID=2930199 RepID=UPI0021F79092|nr:hypothetical protein [Leisingera thetidis]